MEHDVTQGALPLLELFLGAAAPWRQHPSPSSLSPGALQVPKITEKFNEVILPLILCLGVLHQ